MRLIWTIIVVAVFLIVAFLFPTHYILYTLLGCFVFVVIMVVLHFTQGL